MVTDAAATKPTRARRSGALALPRGVCLWRCGMLRLTRCKARQGSHADAQRHCGSDLERDRACGTRMRSEEMIHQLRRLEDGVRESS